MDEIPDDIHQVFRYVEGQRQAVLERLETRFPAIHQGGRRTDSAEGRWSPLVISR